MSELENLRPEAREAVNNFDDLLGGFGDAREFRWQIIRAELLRLAAMEHAWQQWIKDGMRVEFLPPELPK